MPYQLCQLQGAHPRVGWHPVDAEDAHGAPSREGERDGSGQRAAEEPNVSPDPKGEGIVFFSSERGSQKAATLF